eukprot:TRINITY_DN5929_c1_g1_i11.p1 TRINITY_DN5929_c1_g1~~TRINITY_DN5929_c1_g1_i11.p1  ORF type:complete len:231 (+),score=47.10 TRINITY_DN5929_c1_g1_i11:410-1102(+)
MLEVGSKDLVAAAANRVQEFTVQGLANTMWSMAVLRVFAEPFEDNRSSRWWDDASQAISKKKWEFLPQHIANIAWAMATARVDDRSENAADALHSLANEAVCKFGFLAPQNLANIAWAFARLASRPEPLVALYPKLTATSLQGFEPQQLSAISWSFARFEEVNPERENESFQVADDLSNILRTHIAVEAKQRISSFSAQGLANLAFAVASATPTSIRRRRRSDRATDSFH